ncbi:ferric reductase-like transmembrane domain-containing protein [Salicola sp. Rm-C-2C1-2]|uniref:ferredoxin reductase family protein n=1 Tax=Salicola sp. Rm-C-2C1-2 TaxID=3141321 RepID=UPI0032E45AA9
MIAVRITLATFVFALTALWLAAGTGTPTAGQTLQPMITQYTGTMALALMSLAMVLATRPKWLERPLNGLDRMYRLHRWLGITGLGFLLVHWWVSSGEQLRRRRAWAEEPAEGLHSWLQKQEGIAEAVGEWSFYAIVTLLILALVRWFPYHLFQKSHRLLAVAYVFIVYHSLVLMRFDYWSQPIGWVTAALMLAGLIATIIVLTGRIGHSRKVKGTVESLAFYSRLQVLEGTVNLEDGWPGHNPGQFAFIKDEKREGAHPYTIASDWVPEEHRLTFFVKELGDHTREMPAVLKEGMPVTVEGPYGCFDFEDSHSRQIWVAGGIGITPFVARMKYLAHIPGEHRRIDLFLCTEEYDQEAADKLMADANAAAVQLHLYHTPKDGLLTGDRIRATVLRWREASIWFCGPPGFGQSLKRDLVAHGLRKRDFHQELFKMR